jgi:hypothetical protein
MTINSYDDLSPLAKVIYSRYCAGALTAQQVQTFATAGRITQEEADWILGDNCP